MNFFSWFPAITTTGSLAIALWLGRQLISTRLTKSVEHEFNEKIEIVRTELRTSEERLKAELREKEAEITALRSGALSALASRQAAFDKRRLEAVDQLWSSFNALTPARSIVSSLLVINVEAVSSRAEDDPKIRDFFKLIGGNFDFKALDLSGAAKARPFVSPIVWATFTAIQSVTMYSVMIWYAVKEGLDARRFIDHKGVTNLILSALPHYAEFLEQHGPAAHGHVLEALDTKLLSEIQNMLSGAEADKASIEQSAEIIRHANALKEKLNTSS